MTDSASAAAPAVDSPHATWWRDAVIYQVYIRSFRDGSGDGIGDIAGIRAGLANIAALGVDAIWINPWYPSPMADAGYDVADYRDVEPMFGTLGEAEALIEAAHAQGLRVLLDIVPNHTSDQHPWFQAALAAGPGSPERARYIFRSGRGEDGSQPPNDWRSVFGGLAWTRVTESDGTPGEWYLHLFAPEQPDLDWNDQSVHDEFEDILRFWFDRGVDGFRIDVAHGLVKRDGLPDLGRSEEELLEPADTTEHPHWDRDGVHEIWQRWRAIADTYDPRRVFVAEAWVTDPARLALYLRPDELHTAFNFDVLRAPWRADHLRETISSSIAGADLVGAPPTWVLSNHDVVRHLSRYARPVQPDGPAKSLTDMPPGVEPDLELGTRRARAAAMLMLALPGSAYVYQGEELGLWEVEDLPAELKQDPAFERSGRENPGRDGCRVPLPWSGSTPPFGFTPATDASDPWLPQPATWAPLTPAAQRDDPGSMLALYRDALRIRREHPALGDGTLSWLDLGGDDVVAFRREPGFTCIVNLGDRPLDLPSGTTLLTSVPATGGTLAPDTAAWLRD